MRYIKYVLLCLCSLFLLNLNVDADACDSNDIARLEELAKNVTISYEYFHSVDFVNFYDVYVSGLTNEMYAIIEKSAEERVAFYYKENEDVIGGTVSAGDVTLKIYSENCLNKKIGELTVFMPYYNTYSTYEQCKNISGDDLEVCSEFLDKKINYDYFVSEIERYNNKNILDDNGNNIFKYVLSAICVGIIIFVLVFVVLRVRKRNRLD